jgi:hypothetical protein
MEQEEPVAGPGRPVIPLVEPLDTVGQSGEKILIARHFLAGGIRPIAQKRKVEVAFGIGEIVHFELLDLLLDVALTREQHGDDDQSSELRRHAFT